MENSYNPQEKQYKLLLIGEQAVGKSSLMNRYVDNVFEMNIMGTAGLDLKKKIVEIKGEKIKVFIFMEINGLLQIKDIKRKVVILKNFMK